MLIVVKEIFKFDDLMAMVMRTSPEMIVLTAIEIVDTAESLRRETRDIVVAE